MSERAILSVKWTAAGRGTRIGGFLRYVSFRDHRRDLAEDRRLEGLLRYVAHRDPTATRGRVFDADGPAGDMARSELLRFVERSTAGRKGDARRPERAVYRFVLSPEHAEGLDLKRLTRATMLQLERDTGGLGPWVAAEHRNSEHPHVHIVLAAKRETEPGRYRSVVVTKQRLARMKLALGHDLERQREGRPLDREWAAPTRGKARASVRQDDEERPRQHPRFRGVSHWLGRDVQTTFRRMARHYRHELEMEAIRREREDERER